MKMYQPIPVDAARRIAQECAKDLVVIVGFDHQNNRIDVTPCSASPADKHRADGLAIFLMDAICRRAPSTMTWQLGEPPHDRQVIIIGNLVYHDEEYGYSRPVVTPAHWSDRCNDWLDEYGMSIRNCVEETLVIHHWIEMPAVSSAPEVTAPAISETLPDGSRVAVHPVGGAA